jgi:hypothetical protein
MQQIKRRAIHVEDANQRCSAAALLRSIVHFERRRAGDTGIRRCIIESTFPCSTQLSLAIMAFNNPTTSMRFRTRAYALHL